MSIINNFGDIQKTEVIGIGIAKRTSAVDQVVEYMKLAIRSGKYQTGDKLPNEATLSSMIGVGRSTLREAMRILAAYGMVEIRQGDGTFVVNQVAERFFDVLGYMPASNIQEIMNLRYTVEVGAIIMVYNKLTKEDFSILQGYIDQLNAKYGIEVCALADRNFHKHLMNITGNQLLIPIEEFLNQMRRNILYQSFSDKRFVDEARKSHENILAALKTKNRDACIEAMLIHLDGTRDRAIQVGQDDA